MKKEELKKELEKLKDFKLYVFEGDVYVKAEDYKGIAIENKKLKKRIEILDNENMCLNAEIKDREEENKKLKEENQYREDIADVLPEGEGHIAEETIQDLQKRIDELVWFEKEYHRSRDRIKKLEWILEHEYGRKVPY